MKISKLFFIMCILLIGKGVLAGGAQDKLWPAIMQCDLEEVKKWIDKGADPFAMHPSNQNALALAYFCPDVTAYLLELGVDPNSDGGNALCGAANNYSIEVLKMLLDAGAIPDSTSAIYGATAAELVIRQTNCVPCLQMLKDAGANLTRIAANNMNLVHTLAMFGQTQEQRKSNFALAAPGYAGYGLNVPEWLGNLGPDRNGTSAEMLDILIEAGCDIDAQTSKEGGGFTPLMMAAGAFGAEGKVFVAKALLERGADVNIKSLRDKETVMGYASKNKSRELVGMIEELGGKSKNKAKETPFSQLTADVSKIKVSLDYPAEGRASKDGSGYSVNVDLLDPKPKRVALISYYLYDPSCSSSSAKTSVSGMTTAEVAAWRMPDLSAQVCVDAFYERSIDQLKAGFSQYGIDLLTPDQFLDTEEKEDIYYGFNQESAKSEKVERTQYGQLGLSVTVSTIKASPTNKGYRPFFVANEPKNESPYAIFINMGVGGANRKMTSSLGYELANAMDVDAVVVCYIVARRPEKNKTDLTVDAVSMYMFGPNPFAENADDKNRGQFYCGTRFFAKNSIFSSEATGTDYANIGNVMTALANKMGNYVMNREK